MKEKIQKIAKLAIMAIMVIVLVIGIITLVKSLFEEKEILTMEQLLEYTVSKNLVKDYTTYYYIEDSVDNLIEAVKREEYNAIYELYIKDYRKGISKSEIISTLKETFKVENGTNYTTNGIYNIDVYGQLACIKINGQDVNILFNFNNRGGASYSFALIK